ncbi:MAG: proton-conducting transporter membrane subunit, partial [Antricoccus sp.]
MIWLLGAHLLAAVLAPSLVRRFKNRAFFILALAPAGSFAWLLAQSATVASGGAVVDKLNWVPQLGLDLDFRLTTLSWAIGLLVTGVGALVLIYCSAYFSPDDAGLWRFSATLTAFAGAMLGLVLTDNLLVLYIFWELTTVFAFLLVGHNPTAIANRRAAMQALIVTTFGGLAMLIGIVLIGQTSTYGISDLLAAPPQPSPIIISGALLMLLGALTKSALVPFHFWLPGAMAAPTPVSAYLHAAAMVKAGVYLVLLLSQIFATIPGWRALTLGLGIATMIIGGWRAMRQYDIKLLLAYGTVSQLGFLVALGGVGTKEAALAALAMTIAHALFKSTLFLCVGIIDHTAHTRDLRRLSGLWRSIPVVFGAATLAALSMAGIIPLAGFLAKESAFDAALHLSADASLSSLVRWLVLAGFAVGSILTVAYTARFMWGAFATKPGVEQSKTDRVGVSFVAAPAILSLLCLLLGFLGPAESTALEPYFDAMPFGSQPPELAIWHGITIPLVVSI